MNAESAVLVIPTDGNAPEELVDALLSWFEFGPPLEKVILLGVTAPVAEHIKNLTDPEVLQPSIHFVPLKQHQRRPRKNQQEALREALLSLSSDDNRLPMIWTHDDIHLTQPVTLEELTRLSQCALPTQNEALSRRVSGGVAQATQTTLLRLKYLNLPTHNYELHLPLVIRRGHVNKVLELLPIDNDVQFRSWVLNHLQKEPREHIEDVKVFRKGEQIQSHGIFSTSKHITPEDVQVTAKSLQQLIASVKGIKDS